MKLTKLVAAPERAYKVPPRARAAGMDAGTASQLIPGVGRTTAGAAEMARTMRTRRRASMVLATLFMSASCEPSRVEKDRVIARAAPLIAAIEHYEADAGRPPASLEELVPKYIRQIPSTGLTEFSAFSYTVLHDEPNHWKVSVRLETLGFKHMRYDPKRRYEIPVRELHDGWVVVSP